MRKTSASAIGFALAVSAASAAYAQVDGATLARAVLEARSRGDRALPASAFVQGALPVMIESRAGPLPEGAVRLSSGFGALLATPEQLTALSSARPDLMLSWAPPRRPLVNRATAWVGAGVFRNIAALSGRGVIVGIVDTGFDPAHPDLRDEQGRTRVAWALDLSRPSNGKHEAISAQYGCLGSVAPCAVYAGVDIDEMLATGSSLLPRDVYGHGTHVASLAAGNGLSTEPAKYAGIAPEATFVIARVTRNDGGSIYDPDVVLATRFIFDRASELGMPAVVNLSLGSDFGGHDGSSPLERALAELVPSGESGRAIVVAAGNSAGVYRGVASGYPEPFGIHTEVHVPRSSRARVPVLTPPVGKNQTSATIYIWVASRPGDALRVGVEDGSDELLRPLGPGQSGSVSRSGVTATVINQEQTPGSPVPPGVSGAVIVLDGAWPSGKTFAVSLEGHGTASLWLQSEGDLAPGTSLGALFPRATKEGTIGVPASSPALIAVGATLNRSSWTDRGGTTVQLQSFGAAPPTEDSAAYFSGVGPNTLGQIKPDISAPGAFVIGAMSTLADPSANGQSGMFAGSASCGGSPGCLVVDDHHAVTSGTSMAAPIVAGAIALLFERDPTLSQREVLALMQAGARRSRGNLALPHQLGPGILDLMGTLSILNSDESPLDGVPTSEDSWMIVSSGFARPDPNWTLQGMLELRRELGVIVDGFDPARLTLEVSGGLLAKPLTRVAAGLWRFELAAPGGSGGKSMSVVARFDGQLLLARELPIAVDPWVADGGVRTSGGCTAAPVSGSSLGVGWLALLLFFARRRRRVSS